ncbi:hypothetical protein CEH05_16280 [Halobacillus halophilus]|uniref:Lipoprotein n=1 Tax=Halobacillus halophilus (strain ATCC 35676 / DSM 2266 / JCM 20832 / KCTC 3685 / LMG 17431 / NBRC 102448 / NCIMB 2269) TaxID=866895 RepID=I0JR62_HALH3|nr:hypothetical protein [Halobacillus halophilus]ASF40627.1 hypothetical protein CEH05_16280 [Halobacillus halophilus]CCG46632.1 hypothetical protein HBHAL_4291 [Halobacillus halophilus DSM 2266]
MKKFGLLAIAFLFVLGCSNDEDRVSNTMDSKLSEENPVAASNDHNDTDKNVETEENADDMAANSNDAPLEQQIADVMEENDFMQADKIVDYEIKGDYIYVFTHTAAQGLNFAVLKYTLDSVEWETGGEFMGSAPYMINDDPDSPVLTLVETDDPEVKGVKVMGENAKMIQLTKDLTEDYSIEVKYWIHFSKVKDHNLENLSPDTYELIR